MTKIIPFPAPGLPQRLPAGFDHQLDRVNALVMEAFGLATREEILSAARIMGLMAPNGTIISNDETDNARIVEWSAFHTRRQGKALIQVLLERLPTTANPEDRTILTVLATSALGIYRIEAIQPQVGAIVTDVWNKTRQVIYSRTFQNGLEIGNLLMARWVVVGDLATMTALVSRVPDEFLEGMRKLPEFVKAASIADDPDLQDQLAEVVFAVRGSHRQIPDRADSFRMGSGRANRQRNQPCPCGSGRKFKVCCGR